MFQIIFSFFCLAIGTEEPSGKTGPIVGAIVGVLVAIAIVIAVVLMIRMKRFSLSPLISCSHKIAF